MALVTPDPVHLSFGADTTVARWRPLVHWLLAIPHLVVLGALGFVLEVLTVIAFFTVLFAKEVPPGIFGAIVMVHRYQWRVASYFACMRESYPPFDFTTTGTDPQTDPARLTVDPPPELNRWLPLVKWLLIIPHLIVLVFLHLAAFVAVLVGWVAVIVTGQYPVGIRDFIVGVYRWTMRVQAYMGFITDRYPPFSLEESPGAAPMTGTASPVPG